MVENLSRDCRSGHSPFDILAEEQTSSWRRPVMNRVNGEPEQVTESDLKRVIEPLASYLCDPEDPKDALTAALAVLISEVDENCSAANAQIATFSGNQWS